MSISAKTLQLLKWRYNPGSYFHDVTGLIPSPNQKALLEGIASLKIKHAIVCAARTTGKTMTLGVGMLYLVTVIPYFLNQRVEGIILSGSQRQSDILYDYCTRFSIQHPFLKEELLQEPQRLRLDFKQGTIFPLPASEKSILGQHRDILFIDEAVEAGDKLIQIALPIVSASPIGLTVLSSTPYEYFSLFVDIWENPQKFNFTRFGIWRARECPWISSEAQLMAKQMLASGLASEEEYKIHWEGEPYQLQGAFFPHSDLRECVFEGKPMIGMGPVTMGIDWGWTAGTAVVITQREGDQFNVLYADLKKKERFEDIQEEILRLCKEYKVEKVFVDASHIGENQRLGKDIVVEEVQFKNEKGRMQASTRHLVESHRLHFSRDLEGLVRSFRKYTPEKKPGQDFVDATMLATFEAIEEGAPPIWYGKIEGGKEGEEEKVPLIREEEEQSLQ